MLEEAILSRLLADTAVAAAVGTRITPVVRAQASPLPAITFTTISAIPSYSDDGEDGIREDRMQIDCWGSSYTSAKQTARAVVNSLSAFGGDVGAQHIRYITLDIEHDLQEGGSNASEYLYRTSLDFLMVYDN